MSYYWECFKRGFCSPISRWAVAIVNLLRTILGCVVIAYALWELVYRIAYGAWPK